MYDWSSVIQHQVDWRPVAIVQSFSSLSWDRGPIRIILVASDRSVNVQPLAIVLLQSLHSHDGLFMILWPHRSAGKQMNQAVEIPSNTSLAICAQAVDPFKH